MKGGVSVFDHLQRSVRDAPKFTGPAIPCANRSVLGLSGGPQCLHRRGRPVLNMGIPDCMFRESSHAYGRV
jgi:hypothetical protein